MDLFTHHARTDSRGQPLAERMRPHTLDEFVGQEHLLGKGKLLSSLEGVPSLVLWGPPGTGKTTLARLLAGRSGARLVVLSAVTAGVKDLRDVISVAERERGEFGRQTILFLDEIHRFNKGQQDALLPTVEAGLIILIGATTENPSFEVNAALLSRCRVLRLEPLPDTAIRRLIDRAIDDRERGLRQQVVCAEAVRDLLAEAAHGDARRALNTLELASQLARPTDAGPRRVDELAAREALQRGALCHSREDHYLIASAFIKSLRGSDPDAAVYWMIRMMEAGEDSLFLMRRMVIFASEDVGMADPHALQVAVAATEAVRFVGLPEAVFPMTQAALYLATAPKSNSALTTSSAARQAVAEHGPLPVPYHLRNATTSLNRQMGYGAGYRYPHDDSSAVDQTYLPDKLLAQRFYQPRQVGYEQRIAERHRVSRSASLEAPQDEVTQPLHPQAHQR